MTRAEIEDQILALLDGDLSAEQIADLESVLRKDPELMQSYVRLAALQNALETRFGGATEAGRTTLMPVGRVVARQRRMIWRRSLVAASILLLGVAVTMAFILAPSSPPQVATFKTTPDSRYLLSYEGDGEAPDDGRLAVGSRLRVSEGAFEGIFSNGTSLVAEAPCDLRILAENRVAIGQGAAWFLVPEDAKGFTAETAQLVVVDLGTEFGVVSKPEGLDEIHVITGVVEATGRSEPDIQEVLHAGMARRLGEDGKLVEIEPDPSRFRKQLDSFSGEISKFTFTGPPWTSAKESDFSTFARNSPSEDSDFLSSTSILATRGFTSGVYQSFYIRDADIGGSIFSTSATSGVGMNLAGATQAAPTNYVRFSVTPSSGYETEFHSFSFYTGAHAANESYQVELRAWDGSAETSLGSVSHETGEAENEPVEFKSIDFADFVSDNSIEFRLYAWGIKKMAQAPVSSGIRFDDIVLEGSSRAISAATGTNR